MTDIGKQLNPFELKTLILNIIKRFSDLKDIADLKNLNVEVLDAQIDKKTITKILYKELYNANNSNEYILRILLERFAPKEELTAHLWNLLKNNHVSNETKIVALNFLRDLDSNLSYDECGQFLQNEEELIDHDTQLLLANAIINPEVQIDFLDFVNSLNPNDKITLLKSLGNDYTEDALANILAPVFLANPYSEEGKTALELLGDSRSQLAYHALDASIKYAKEDIQPAIKRNLSKLKLAGIREDNTHEFYKKLLSDTKPYVFCLTYPDGHGNQALIFTREKDNERIQFVAVVIDDYNGIKDCFGFNDISKFECDKIIERFYQDEPVLKISPEALKAILINAERLSDKFPYEYICWKNLLADIEPDDTDLKQNVTKNIKNIELTTKELETLTNDEFTQHWFLDYNYSDETENMFNSLNSKLLKQEYKLDFDKVVEDNLHTIFYEEEYKIWSERLIMCAYLKLLTDRKQEAELIFALYNNEDMKQEFFKNILKRSIYEYYFALKFNTELNNGKFSLNELDYIIKLIENRWVQNV
ncbi:hypothetical protein IKU74_05230 [bacterium]|nr:hypothetical protein [bacterium]